MQTKLIIVRCSNLERLLCNRKYFYGNSSRCYSETSGSGSDDEKVSDPQVTSNSRERARNRMASLLKSLAEKPIDSTTSQADNLKLAQPTPPKKDSDKVPVVEKDPFFDAKIKQAAKDVAIEIGGEAKATETELINSFMSHSVEKSLSELLVGMKVDRSESSSEKEFQTDSFGIIKPEFKSSPPKSQLRGLLRKSKLGQVKSVDINSGEPLQIFPRDYKAEGRENILETWSILEKREKKLATSVHPRNGFEEMIQWTEKGLLWTFPIDNEIGLEDEKKIHFSDHIFLEKHLDGWCPKKGPLRHFMELVCVGLSKNPYITLERKKRQIVWYKNYFESKRELLTAVGAM